MDLHYLADAALADATAPATATGRSPITLPPISALISPSSSTPANYIGSRINPAIHTPVSGSRSEFTLRTPVSGSSITSNFTFSSNTHVPPASAIPPSGEATDQPRMVTGWSPSSTQTQNQPQQPMQRYVNAAASGSHLRRTAPSSDEVATAANRSQKGSKQRGRQPDRKSFSSNVQLEYNVRPYKRIAPSPSTPATGQPTRKQPSRPSQSDHPLKYLKLDKTYPERSPQVWHEDAQRLLRPPRTLTPPSADKASSLNKHSAAQALRPPAITTRRTKSNRSHPPVAPWDEIHPLPQMPLDDPYLPQTQGSNNPMRSSLHRHGSSSSHHSPSWDSRSLHALPAVGAHTVGSHPPPMTHEGRPLTSPQMTAHLMRRSLSAHTGDGSRRDRVGHVPMSAPGSPRPYGGEHKVGEGGSPRGRIGARRIGTNGNGDRDGGGDDNGVPTPVTGPVTGGYGLSRLALPPPVLPAFRANPPSPLDISRTITPSLSLSAITSTPPELALPSSGDIDQRASTSYLASRGSIPPPLDSDAEALLQPFGHHDVSGDTSAEITQESLSQEIAEPDLDMDQSSVSQSSFELLSDVDMSGEQEDERDGEAPDRRSDGESHYTASQDSRGIKLRLRIPFGEASSSGPRSGHYTSASGASPSSSFRGRSGSTGTDLTEVKEEPTGSPDSETPSPVKPKRAKRKAAESSKSAGESGSSRPSRGAGSRSGSTRQKGQRRNGERRREQNAVAQKKFRWKKKQIAAQMEADLGAANALAASLKKENEEKDRLVSKLRGELGTLKRKLEKLES
ncbi:hypothetical protein IAU59_006418 [Kwoniella sp. CBS 9459]